jgi:hypothetical protein
MCLFGYSQTPNKPVKTAQTLISAQKKGTKPKAQKGCYGISIGKQSLSLIG